MPWLLWTLNRLDTPERKQAFGKRSKEYLSDLVAGESVLVNWNKRDRYKRIVGKVIHQGQYINLTNTTGWRRWLDD